MLIAIHTSTVNIMLIDSSIDRTRSDNIAEVSGV